MHSATTPISFAMSQNPLSRTRHFALHCDQDGGAEICVPIGDHMRTAALPVVFVFRRRLWLPVASWMRNVGWNLLRISSAERTEPKSLALSAAKVFTHHSSKSCREDTTAGVTDKQRLTRVASGWLYAEGSNRTVRASFGVHITASPPRVDSGICYAPLSVVTTSPRAREARSMSALAEDMMAALCGQRLLCFFAARTAGLCARALP